MLKRICTIVVAMVAATTLLVQPAGAQAPPLQGVVDSLNTVLDGAKPATDGLKPVTDAVGGVVAQLAPTFQQLADQLNALVSQVGGVACGPLQPVVAQLQPVIAQLQPAVNLLQNPPASLAFLSPLLTQVGGLIANVTNLCAAQVTTTTTTTTTAAPAVLSGAGPTDAPGLPRTGGPEMALPALAAFALGGLVYAARKRLAV